MECKFAFQDGSEAIAHYGVPGMKWGHWNAETRAKYTGAGNGTYYKKAKRGSEYGHAVTNQRRAYNANQPKSKQVAKVLLLGPGGAHAYNTSRSRGLSRADSLQNAGAGFLYAQGVKHKQKKLGTTEAMVSKAAKERADYGEKESFKKSAMKQFIGGGSASMAYNSVKARTKSRGKAALAATGVFGAQLVGAVGGTPGAAVAGVAATGLLRKGEYKKQTKANKFKTRRPGETVNPNPKKYETWDPSLSKKKNKAVYKAKKKALKENKK